MTWKPSEVRPDTKASVSARRRVWAGATVGAGDAARAGPGERRRSRELGVRRGGSRAPVQHQRDRAGRPGADRADHQRPGEPEQLDQHEARERRADDRPDGVGRVQPLEGTRDAAAALRQVARQRGQRRAHDQRRGRQRQDREREAHQRQRERSVRQGRVDAAVHLADEPEGDRRQQHDHHHDQLQEAVQPQGARDPVRHAPADRAADREAPEEPGEDRGHGLARVAEHQHQLAGPHDLVDQAGRAGQDEQEEQGGQRHRSVTHWHGRTSAVELGGRSSRSRSLPRTSCARQRRRLSAGCTPSTPPRDPSARSSR